MRDALLPTPASICSQKVDCKWVRRSIGGSVLCIDMARDTVSVDMNIKSSRGHTSIHLTPWDSQAQYRRWNNTYRPCDNHSMNCQVPPQDPRRSEVQEDRRVAQGATSTWTSERPPSPFSPSPSM